MVELNQLLLDFERNLKSEGVKKEWKERRESWVEECLGASIVQEVSSLLREVETNTNSEAMADEWQQNREKWVQEMHEYQE
jgi:hypothetical protein